MVGKDEISELYDFYFGIKTCDIEFRLELKSKKRFSIRYVFGYKCTWYEHEWKN